MSGSIDECVCSIYVLCTSEQLISRIKYTFNPLTKKKYRFNPPILKNVKFWFFIFTKCIILDIGQLLFVLFPRKFGPFILKKFKHLAPSFYLT
jgi:hypothetical protein